MWSVQPIFWKRMHEPNRTHLWFRSGWGLSVCILCTRLVTAQLVPGLWPPRAWVRTSPSKAGDLKSEKWWTLWVHVSIQRLPCLGCLRLYPAMCAFCGNDCGVRMLGCQSWNFFFLNVCVMSPAQGNEPLGNHAQMQRKPKILKSWTVSFLLSFAWVWVCFLRQDAGEYAIIAIC